MVWARVRWLNRAVIFWLHSPCWQVPNIRNDNVRQSIIHHHHHHHHCHGQCHHHHHPHPHPHPPRRRRRRCHRRHIYQNWRQEKMCQCRALLLESGGAQLSAIRKLIFQLETGSWKHSGWCCDFVSFFGGLIMSCWWSDCWCPTKDRRVLRKYLSLDFHHVIKVERHCVSFFTVETWAHLGVPS